MRFCKGRAKKSRDNTPNCQSGARAALAPAAVRPLSRMHEFLEKYLAYKKEEDREAGREFARRLYQILSRWLEEEKPDAVFVQEFEAFFARIDERELNPRDLLDVGVVHAAEAVSAYRSREESPESLRFYVNEARQPFFALIEENAYRMLKNFDFTEIDFQIFDIIQGPFPHDAAQNFLLENGWVDVWAALRYIDSLPESQLELELLERIMLQRETPHERLILLAYLYFARRPILDAALEASDPRSVFNFTDEFTPAFLLELRGIIDESIRGGELSTAFEDRLPGRWTDEIVFFLLAYFEISHAPLSPGWVRLLEIGIASLWTATAQESGEEIVYQPSAEFTASLLGLFTEEELNETLSTALILPRFFENLERYNPEAFQAYVSVFARAPDLLLAELELSVGSDLRDRMRNKRLAALAEAIGYEIVRKAGAVRLVKRGGATP